MKTILVTGGAGFVGSSIIKELKKRDNDCVIKSLDNYTSGYASNHIEGVEYIEGDTWDIDTIETLEAFQPDLVFHFGEFSRIVPSFEHPELALKSNQYGTLQVLNYCLRKKAKLVYSGSSAIFGNDMKDQHLNPYSWSKAKNIELIHNFKDWFGLQFAICYFYNVYGPGQILNGTYATVIGIFEKQFAQSLPLTVVSPGTQTRAFTHISDIVSGVLLVASQGEGDRYFLGNTENVSILDVADMFGSTYTLIPERRGERVKSVIHESRARTELGWIPKVELRKYIKEQCTKFTS
ncbi:MAG: NAD-dependent epimerase/dehydratase family protein [Rhodothermaceae bacterium TMED105]|jgi:UDP-glucose 4-epimerase|nr:MAG: NAD-dependent epimerase/dehydratase family protein [Rhodothermaceae bacterium TMED105]|tara:strand:+ start:1955 stop:2833 length:879 start_codon:yes stop_codon:yes gene_type:complete